MQKKLITVVTVNFKTEPLGLAAVVCALCNYCQFQYGQAGCQGLLPFIRALHAKFRNLEVSDDSLLGVKEQNPPEIETPKLNHDKLRVGLCCKCQSFPQ